MAMVVKKPASIMRLICGYCNGCKKLAIITKPICNITYLKWPCGNYNIEDVGIAQCSF